MSNGVWHIASEDREKGNAGSLVLPPQAIKIIEVQPRMSGNPYVFTVHHGPFNVSQSKRRLAAKLSPMPRWTLHDLRRTARSLMSRAGVRADIGELVLGHKIPGVKGIYDRFHYRDEKVDALLKLAAQIETIVNPPTGNVLPLRAPP